MLLRLWHICKHTEKNYSKKFQHGHTVSFCRLENDCATFPGRSAPGSVGTLPGPTGFIVQPWTGPDQRTLKLDAVSNLFFFPIGFSVANNTGTKLWLRQFFILSVPLPLPSPPSTHTHTLSQYLIVGATLLSNSHDPEVSMEIDPQWSHPNHAQLDWSSFYILCLEGQLQKSVVLRRWAEQFWL